MANQRNAKPMILVGLVHAHLIASLETRTGRTAIIIHLQSKDTEQALDIISKSTKKIDDN